MEGLSKESGGKPGQRDESRKVAGVQGRSCRGSAAIGRTLVATPGEMGAMEGSEQRREVIVLAQASDDGGGTRVVAEKVARSGQILGRFGRQNQEGLLVDPMWDIR